jgi:hypothetical protein
MWIGSHNPWFTPEAREGDMKYIENLESDH